MTTLSAKFAVAIVVASIFVQLAGIGGAVVLVPAYVIERLWLWQPLTYAFIARAPFEVIFGALILWSIGSALETSFGRKRYVIFLLGTTIAAAVLTVLAAVVWTSARAIPHSGAGVMMTTVWVAYGLYIGRGPANFWGFPVTGNVLALIGIGFVLLMGIFNSFPIVLAEVFAIVVTIGYMRTQGPRLWWLRLQSWLLQRRMSRRSRHLKVIGKERNMRSDSDRFIH